MSSDLEQRLASGAHAAGVSLDGEQLRALLELGALLLHWNRRIQLTSCTDQLELVERHLVDCLYPVPHLAGVARIVDVGSGGGLPGLVLAVALPDAALTLLEPVHKKRAFLAAARRQLGLTGVEARAERVEDHLEQGAPRYGAAISRAVWAPHKWLSIGRRLVESGGLVIAMEGAEQGPIPAGARRQPYRLPDRRRRSLILWPQP